MTLEDVHSLEDVHCFVLRVLRSNCTVKLKGVRRLEFGALVFEGTDGPLRASESVFEDLCFSALS